MVQIGVPGDDDGAVRAYPVADLVIPIPNSVNTQALNQNLQVLGSSLSANGMAIFGALGGGQALGFAGPLGALGTLGALGALGLTLDDFFRLRAQGAELKTGKPTAIVAGALHFSGPRSVIALLQKRGYLIEQL